MRQSRIFQARVRNNSRDPTLGQEKIEKTINFWSSFAYARLLGEDRHHGIKFSLNSRLKH
jgi:hypothetical protein